MTLTIGRGLGLSIQMCQMCANATGPNGELAKLQVAARGCDDGQTAPFTHLFTVNLAWSA